MNDIKGRNFLVVGLGETGFDAACVLHSHGANVRVTEIKNNSAIQGKKKKLVSRGIDVETGHHSVEYVEWADIIVPSPGIPLDAAPILHARTRSKKIVSEIEIAYWLSDSKKIIAITGTNGKTTTVSLVDLIFEKANIPHITCGNIGNSFIGELDRIDADTWIILEVSSFQLEYIEKFQAFIGTILNITGDHLDYYSNFSQYLDAKKKLFINSDTGDWAILNYDDNWCREIANGLKCNKIFFSSKNRIDGICIIDDSVYFKERKLFSLDIFRKSRLTGLHNLENIMAAAGIATITGLSLESVINAIIDFIPLKHRIEKVATINGITFIDDSKATNVDAVCRALESFPKKNNIMLILGGKDKGFSFEPLKDFLKDRVRLIFVIGETTGRIKRELFSTGIEIREIKNFNEAVRIAVSDGNFGDIVLLSPGCSSFDMFTSYAERGDVFKTAVKNLL